MLYLIVPATMNRIAVKGADDYLAETVTDEVIPDPRMKISLTACVYTYIVLDVNDVQKRGLMITTTARRLSRVGTAPSPAPCADARPVIEELLQSSRWLASGLREHSMRERLELLGGRLAIVSRPSSSTERRVDDPPPSGGGERDGH